MDRENIVRSRDKKLINQMDLVKTKCKQEV
jgi:hypothetical protein